jgi:hypothetical protein
MSLNTTDITNGVSVSGSTNPFNTYIKKQNAGVYNIQFSAQFDRTNSGTDVVYIWLRKNGIDIAESNASIIITGGASASAIIAAWNWFVNSSANDYYQIMWSSGDTHVRILAETPAYGPQVPSIIVTANRVDQFLSNTGSFTGSFTGEFTGSLFGTASYVSGSVFTSTNPALSASYAATASYVLQAVSASFATTASYVTGSVHTSTNPALSASYALSASQAITASYVVTAQTASYVVLAQSASFLVSSSFSTNIGDGTNTSYTVTHNLNTRNAHITVYSASDTYETVYPDIQRPTVNTAAIIFANPPTTNQYIVYVSI